LASTTFAPNVSTDVGILFNYWVISISILSVCLDVGSSFGDFGLSFIATIQVRPLVKNTVHAPEITKEYFESGSLVKSQQ